MIKLDLLGSYFPDCSTGEDYGARYYNWGKTFTTGPNGTSGGKVKLNGGGGSFSNFLSTRFKCGII